MKKSEHWHGHFKAQRESGLSQNAYCVENGLSPSSFRYWQRQLSKKSPGPRGRFVSLAPSPAPLEVVVGSVVVRVAAGSDLSELRRVVEALS